MAEEQPFSSSSICFQVKQEVVIVSGHSGGICFHKAREKDCVSRQTDMLATSCHHFIVPLAICDSSNPSVIDKLTHPVCFAHALPPLLSCGLLKVNSRETFCLRSPGVVAAKMSHFTNIVYFPQGVVVGGGICRIHSALIDHLEHVTHQRVKRH